MRKHAILLNSFGGGGSWLELVLNRIGFFNFLQPVGWAFLPNRITSHVTLHSSLKRNSAFTLAEVLITLGIIGVIALLVISHFIADYKERVTVTKLNSAYNQLFQASRLMLADLNPDNVQENVWGEYPSRTFTELLPKYLNVREVKRKKTCCKNMIGTTIALNYGTSKTFVLPNGVEINIPTATKVGTTYVKCNMTTKYNLANSKTVGTLYFNSCGVIAFDVNGFDAGPNVWGKDAFRFSLVMDGIIPYGMPKESVHTNDFNSGCLNKSTLYPGGCSAWIILNKNMDYLHCPEKLGWEKQLSCKEQ